MWGETKMLKMSGHHQSVPTIVSRTTAHKNWDRRDRVGERDGLGTSKACKFHQLVH